MGYFYTQDCILIKTEPDSQYGLFTVYCIQFE